MSDGQAVRQQRDEQSREQRRRQLLRIVARAAGMPSRPQSKRALELLDAWLRGIGADSQLQREAEVEYTSTIAMGIQNPRKVSTPTNTSGADTAKRRLLGWGQFLDAVVKHPGPWATNGLRAALEERYERQALAELLGEATVPSREVRVELVEREISRVYADGNVRSCMHPNSEHNCHNFSNVYDQSPSVAMLAARLSDGRLVGRALVVRGLQGDRTGIELVRIYDDGSDRQGTVSRRLQQAHEALCQQSGSHRHVERIVLQASPFEGLPYLDSHCAMEWIGRLSEGRAVLLNADEDEGSDVQCTEGARWLRSQGDRPVPEWVRPHLEHAQALGPWPKLPDELRYNGPWVPGQDLELGEIPSPFAHPST